MKEFFISRLANLMHSNINEVGCMDLSLVIFQSCILGELVIYEHFLMLVCHIWKFLEPNFMGGIGDAE